MKSGIILKYNVVAKILQGVIMLDGAYLSTPEYSLKQYSI
jgi:hypothetical protein